VFFVRFVCLKLIFLFVECIREYPQGNFEPQTILGTPVERCSVKGVWY